MTVTMRMCSLHQPTVSGGIGASTILSVGDGIHHGITIIGMVRAIGMVAGLIITIIIITGIRDIITTIIRFMQV